MKKFFLYLFLCLNLSAEVQAQLLSVPDAEIDFAFKPTGEVTELKYLTKTKNQADAEECFLFAFLTYWEDALYSRSEIAPPPISAPYVTIRKLQMYIDQTLTHGYSDVSLEGGFVQDIFLVMHQYGVVAEESWKPAKTWRYWDLDPIYKNIHVSIKKWQKILEQTKKSFGAESPEYLESLEQAKEQTFRYVTDLSGEVPDRVDFRGQNLTTQEMLAYYKLDQNLEINWMFPSYRWSEDDVSGTRDLLSSFTRASNSHYRFYPAEHWSDLLETIKKNLDDGEPSLIGMSWESGGGHMLTVIGYQLLGGKVTHLRVQNTWSASWGRNGTAWIAVGSLNRRVDELWYWH